MPLTFPTSGDYLQRLTGAFLDPTLDFTISFWSQQIFAPVYQTLDILSVGSVDYSTNSWLATFTDAGANDIYITEFPGDFAASSGLSSGVWVYTSLRYQAASQTLSIATNGALQQAVTADLSTTGQLHREYLGGDSVGGADRPLSMAYYRSWQAYLSLGELATEQGATTAVRTANLFCDTPLVTTGDLADLSGNGRDWAAVGSPVTFSGAGPIYIPPGPIATGSLALSNAVGGGHPSSMLLIDPLTAADVATIVLAGPVGTSYCAALPSGAFCEGTGLNDGSGGIDFYSATGALVASQTFDRFGNGAVAASSSSFYAAGSTDLGGGDAQPFLVQYTGAGAEVQRWTLPHPMGGLEVSALTVTPDDTIAYYVGSENTTQLRTIYAYDLVNNAALPDLTTQTPPMSPPWPISFFQCTAVLALSGGLIVSTWSAQYDATSTPPRAGQTTVLKFQNDGTLLHTWTPPLSFDALSPGLSNSLSQTTTFYVTYEGATFQTRVYAEWLTADGSVVQTCTQTSANRQNLGNFFVWRGSGSTPLQGASPTSPWTPVLVNNGAPRLPIPPPLGPTVVVPMRQLRRSPHYSKEQVRTFCDMFQLDCQQGSGTPANPDPAIDLRVSTDGGYSWSPPIPLSPGEGGDYIRQCRTFMLGQGRNWVFETSTTNYSGPWIAAYVTMRKGTS